MTIREQKEFLKHQIIFCVCTLIVYPWTTPRVCTETLGRVAWEEFKKYLHSFDPLWILFSTDHPSSVSRSPKTSIRCKGTRTS